MVSICGDFMDWRDWAGLVHLRWTQNCSVPRIAPCLNGFTLGSVQSACLRVQDKASQFHPISLPFSTGAKGSPNWMLSLSSLSVAGRDTQSPLWGSKFAILVTEVCVQICSLQLFAGIIKNRSGDARAEH